MNVLIVYAHERANSFNYALLKQAQTTLSNNGHEVVISDLYALNFNPVASKNDFLFELEENDCYESAQRKAVVNNGFSDDIKQEITKVLNADLIIFQFPLWWHSMPAIMQGWLDRVFINGLMYGNQKWHSKGLLKGKKALLSFTTGAPVSTYGINGMNGTIDALLYNFKHGVFSFVGMDYIDPFISYSPAFLDEQQRKDLLNKYHEYLVEIEKQPTTPPLDLDLINEIGQFK